MRSVERPHANGFVQFSYCLNYRGLNGADKNKNEKFWTVGCTLDAEVIGQHERGGGRMELEE